MERIRYCVLAKSVPEYSKRDDTLYTCTLGYSPQKGLIRVYPIPIKNINKWDCFDIPIEKNKWDTREESWKLSSYSRKNGWIGFDDDVRYVGKARPQDIERYLRHYTYLSISQLNDRRMSIGLIEAIEYKFYWEVNKRFVDENQFGMFEDVELAYFTAYTKETKGKEARVKFKDRDGWHDLQFNNWGIYEYQRKFQADKDAFRFLNPTGSDYFLIGNMHNHRSSWIVLDRFLLTKQNAMLL